jgi:isopenicillin N synthase-like dioxygenase
MSIPVVDLSTESIEENSAVLQQIHNAFTAVGFLFVRGHGIPREMIDRVLEEAKQFFSLPQDLKSKYRRTANSNNNGYVALLEENIDPSKPADLKECFNITSLKECSYPDTEVPSLRSVAQEFFPECCKLALLLLRLMGHALKLNAGYPEDPELFVKAHAGMESGNENLTTLRLLHYPPLPPERAIPPGQLRCGEHVDYGSITLLFQDPCGGLQVKQTSGGYTDVPYRGDAVLVNLGALMQNWTSDQYMATVRNHK